jgi:hypothetical protein
MAEHVITEKQLSAALRREAKQVPQKLARAALRAAHRGKAHLIRRTKEKGITDMGQYANSFEVKKGLGDDDLATITNTAPHAGIIELGARPHPVSREGFERIREWVARKMLGISATMADENEEVDRIAWAIVKKIERYGQAPRHVFKDEQEMLTRFWRVEFERALKGNVGRGWRGGSE